jgi:hypothetical protein
MPQFTPFNTNNTGRLAFQPRVDGQISYGRRIPSSREIKQLTAEFVAVFDIDCDGFYLDG